ncbi:hypothetical protein ARMGADRAFT_1086006 [Armillaria gallica]|uniref:Uncharacterized protein n=1 Tax=Armillaria gallica TaxID=47427 RepID=A0A2H3DHG9_ARMGA|nr:hypothetical protein ARMGADRAFT_1086006 [Armillaria gallica]
MTTSSTLKPSERTARYTPFDVHELQNVAGLSMHSGALTLLKLRKAATTKYSSSNLKVTQAIARIPSSIIGNIELSTAYRHANVAIALFLARDDVN